ncbi:MAG: PDZ domain-containing protein [Sediminibacterium sp.]
MNKHFLPLLALALGLSTLATAQTKENPKKEKEESLIIRKKGDSKEKMTIVIDGENITVNGKPLSELKDSDLEVLRSKEMIASILPRIKNRMAPMGSLKMFGGDDFMTGSNRALLGVTSEKTDKGAKIISVEKETAAEKAGLQKDDIITKIGDTKIEGSDDLFDAIGKYKPEEKVTITYLRDGKQSTTTATLGKTKSAGNRSFNFNGDNFNMNLDGLERLKELKDLPRMNGMDFNFNRKPRLGLGVQDVEEGKDVKVLDVDSDTPAAKAGLQKDDIISELDGKSIASVDDLKNMTKDLKEGDSIKVTYKRGGQTMTTDIKLPKKLKTADL